MGAIIGVAGYCGVGKTTAVDFLIEICHAESVYLGQYVLDEASKHGDNAAAERKAQGDIREQYGRAVLAERALPTIQGYLSADKNVVVDAIFTIEEYQHLKNHAENAEMVLFTITAPFEIRCDRLGKRADRSMTSDEIKKRDKHEAEKLGIEAALNSADYVIDNGGAMDKLKVMLREKWADAANKKITRLSGDPGA